MTLLAIDPGDQLSAFVVYDKRPVDHGKLGNEELLARICDETQAAKSAYDHIAIEMIASYGMPVGAEVFNTCVWIGRFMQAWTGDVTLIFRRDVKLHLCGQARAKDSNVRQALIDKFGGKEKAIGRKSSPGPLHGLKADEWQALAVAVTYTETHNQEAA